VINGRSTKENPRTYGKIKEIKDFKRMLAYTIKGKDFLSTESPELIEECREISFVKEDVLKTIRPILFSYLNKNIEWKTNQVYLEGLTQDWYYPYDNSPQTYSPLGSLKYYILQFYQNNEQYKMPTRSLVNHLAQYYCMYELRMPPCQILNIFFS
jgi:hypothetical protein